MKKKKSKPTIKEIMTYVAHLDDEMVIIKHQIQNIGVSINSIMKLVEEYIDMNGDTKKMVAHMNKFIEKEQSRIEKENKSNE